MRLIKRLIILPFFSSVDSLRYDFLRISFALASLINIIDMWEIRHIAFSEHGIISHYKKQYFTISNYSLFYIEGARSLSGVNFIFLISALFSIFLLFGFLSRFSAFIVSLWTISYVNHIGPLACGYEMILQIFSIVIIISPLNGPLSITGYLNKNNYCPISSKYGLILLQWQVFLIYWTTAFYKVIDKYWQGGETVYYYISSYYGRFTPEQIAKYSELLSYLSDATIAIELALPLLLWNKKTRLLGIFLGLGFHTSIALLSRLSIFSIVIISTYSCFIEREDFRKLRNLLKRN